MIRFIMTIALVCAAANSAFAQTVLGAGTYSCGDWTRYRPFMDRPNDAPEHLAAHQLQSWVTGFLSAYNLKGDGVDFLARPSLNAVIAWMDNYCRSHPLTELYTAAEVLAAELRSRAERK